jgi:para-nitrobenzyl esterase
MSDTWLAFARHGDAGWRPWGAAQPTRLFGSGSDVVDGPRRAELQILRDLPYWDITKPNEL